MIVYCCWFTTYCLWMYKTSENSIWIPMLHLFQYEAIHHFHCVPNHVAAIVKIIRYHDISDDIDSKGMDFVCWVSGCQTPDWGPCTEIYNGTIPSNFTFSEPVYLEKRFPGIVWWDSILYYYNLTSVSGNVCFLIRIWCTICTNLMHKSPSNPEFQECLTPLQRLNVLSITNMHYRYPIPYTKHVKAYRTGKPGRLLYHFTNIMKRNLNMWKQCW